MKFTNFTLYYRTDELQVYSGIANGRVLTVQLYTHKKSEAI